MTTLTSNPVHLHGYSGKSRDGHGTIISVSRQMVDMNLIFCKQTIVTPFTLIVTTIYIICGLKSAMNLHVIITVDRSREAIIILNEAPYYVV